MQPLRHAIFDLDGTLADSLPGIGWSVQRALAACRLPELNRDLGPLLGPPIRSILAFVAGLSDPLVLDRVERAFRASYDGEGWRMTSCYEGVPEMLQELLAGGAGLWVVTNKPSGATIRILRALRIDGFFREVVCPDSRTPAYGSKAEALRDLLSRRGLARDECLLVGDTLEDCQTAVAAGVVCAIVPHGYGQSLPSGLPGNCCRVNGWEDVTGLFEREPLLAPPSAARIER